MIRGRRSRAVRRLGALFGGLAVAACGVGGHLGPEETGGSGGGGGPSGGSAAACAPFASAICSVVDRCVPAWMRVFYGSIDLCVARQEMACALQLAAPETSQSAEKVAACAEALEGASCDGVLRRIAEACPVDPGGRQDGEACAWDAQCESTYCPVGEEGCGTCAPRSEPGGPCEAAPASCPAKHACAADVCTPIAARGESCASGEPCDLALLCVDGTCQVGAGPGEPCDPAHPCDSGRALSCGPEGMCVEPLYAEPREACAGGEVCTAASQCSASGVCVAPAEDGTACGGAPGLTCYAPARCVSGYCTLPDPAACDGA